MLAPAIKLAEDGFVPDWYVALNTAMMSQELAAFPETAKNYLRDGHYIYRTPSMAGGDVLRQPDLGRSLRLVARDGPDAFYKGAIAQALHEEIWVKGGFLTRTTWRATRRACCPRSAASTAGLELAFSPGATGGTTALEMLNILAQFPKARDDVEDAGRPAPARGGRAPRLPRPARVSGRRRAREVAVGGPRLARVRGQGGGGTQAGRAHASRPAPDPWRYDPARGVDCTTHLCAVDRQRNMVSLTNTAVSLWGSRMVAPGTGILLQNGMVWFDPEPGHVNSVAPGKRPLVNMVPALAFKQGKPYLAVGAPGGRKIVSAIPQVIANMADLWRRAPGRHRGAAASHRRRRPLGRRRGRRGVPQGARAHGAPGSVQALGAGHALLLPSRGHSRHQAQGSRPGSSRSTTRPPPATESAFNFRSLSLPGRRAG